MCGKCELGRNEALVGADRWLGTQRIVSLTAVVTLRRGPAARERSERQRCYRPGDATVSARTIGL